MDIKFKEGRYKTVEMLEIMDKYKVDTIEVGMVEDWFWTAETVTREQLKDMLPYPLIAGINKSGWATAIMRVMVTN